MPMHFAANPNHHYVHEAMNKTSAKVGDGQLRQTDSKTFKLMKASFVRIFAILGCVCLFLANTENVNAAARTATVSGNWTNTATWGGNPMPVAGDTVTISSGITVTVNTNGAECTSLQINTANNAATLTFAATGSPKLTVSGAVTVGNSGNANREGIITFTSGSTLVCGSLSLGAIATQTSSIDMTAGGTLIVNGTITVFSGSSWTPGVGTVELTANNTLPASIMTTFNNLTISGGTTILGTAVTVTNLAIGSGDTLDVAAITLTIPGGGTVNVDGTLDFTSSTGLMRSGTSGTSTLTMGANGLIRTADDSGLGPVANGSLQTQSGGAWSLPNLTTAGTVEYNRNATSGQTVTDRDYYNLTITGSTQTKTWTTAAARTVNGNLTINSAAPLTMSGSATLNAKGNWTNSGVFTAGAGTVNFNKTGTQNIAGSSTTTFNQLSVASGAVLAIAAANANASQLSLNNLNQVPGTWGATGSGATRINNTYFSGTSGKLTVARAPIAIGTATSTTASANITVSTPTEGVALSNTIIVTIAMDPGGTITGVADARGNIYTKDADVTNGTGTSGVRTIVYSATVTNALVSGDLITVAFSPNVTSKSVSAFYFAGLLTSTRVDRTAAASGTSTSPSSGNTATTMQPDEVIVGAIGVETTAATTFTAGTAHAALASSVTASATGLGIYPEYRTVSTNGAFAGDGTLSPSRLWAAAVVTYRLQSGELDKFDISALASPQTVAVPFTIATITAWDANSNTVSSFTGTVTNGGTAGVTGTSSAFTAGVLANASVTPTLAGANLTVTVGDSSGRTGSATIATVNKGTPLVATAFTGSAIIFGQALSNSTPTGSLTNTLGASVPGTFAFANPGLNPNAGTTNVSVIFTPTASANYNNVTNTVTLTVNKQTPVLTLAASAITFGQTLANSSLSSSTATNAANGAAVTGTFNFVNTGIAPNAGTTNVSAFFIPADTANYNNVTNTVTLTVNKQTPALTLTASAISYGQTLASSSLAGSTATNAANGAAVTGTFNFVNSGILPSAGTTNVSAFFVPTDSANYNNATNTVIVTVNQATTSVAVSSSMNPAGFTTNVTFTATLPAAATGNVTFKTNGVTLTSATLSSGTATAATASLPRGTNTITAEYAGDGNYLGSTNNLSGGQVVTNRPPVAGNATYTRASGSGLFINIANLLTNVTQRAADHVITLSSVGSGSQGATITISGASIRYSPLPAHNANDSFTYTVSDGQGGTATGNVAVNNRSSTGQVTGQVTVTTNSVTSLFTAVPGWTYYVQRSTNLSVGVGWISINTNLVPTSGLITNVDNFTDLGTPPASAFYRLFLQ